MFRFLSREPYVKALVLMTCAFFIFVFYSSKSIAKPPVVVEMFGMNGCSADMMVQEAVFDLLREHDDVIFINCRKKLAPYSSNEYYTHQFCNDRSAEYANRLSFFGERTPMVVVNGKWDAFYENLDPAVGAGRADQLVPISVALDGGVLNISVPEIANVESGHLFLYAFAPTQGDETMVVDPDVEITNDIKERLAQGQSVPFVTKERVSPYYVRPIVSREKIVNWDGRAFSSSYSLDQLTELVSPEIYRDLSYAVVLHKGDDFGAIVAAGEVLSVAEQNSILLHSRPLDIEFRSTPNPDAIGQ